MQFFPFNPFLYKNIFYICLLSFLYQIQIRCSLFAVPKTAAPQPLSPPPNTTIFSIYLSFRVTIVMTASSTPTIQNRVTILALVHSQLFDSGGASGAILNNTPSLSELSIFGILKPSSPVDTTETFSAIKTTPHSTRNQQFFTNR